MSESENSLCASCNQKVQPGEMFVVINGSVLHSEHFTCSACSTQLDSQGYYTENDKYFCKQCYIDNVAPKCTACGKGVIETIVKTAEGSVYHRDCFVCADCKQVLELNYTVDEEGKMLCEQCIEKLKSKCAGCGNTIDEKGLNVLGKSYHEQCLKCVVCNEPITSLKFAVFNGSPAHSDCTKKTCFQCNQKILEDEFIQKDGKDYHAKCFIQLEKDKQKQQAENLRKIAAEEEEKEIQAIRAQKDKENTQTNTQEQQIPQVEVANQEIKQNEETAEVKVISQETQEKTEKVEEKVIEDENHVENQQKVEETQNQKQNIQVPEVNPPVIEKQPEVNKVEVKEEHKQQNIAVSEPVKIPQNHHIEETITQPKLKVAEESQQKSKEIITIIPKEESIPEKKETTQTLFYSYAELIKTPLPAEIDFTKKEQYLTEEEFKQIFKMSKNDFNNLKAWKKNELKQTHKLF